MYDNTNQQYSQLVMTVRKAETQTPGSGVPEARAKSAVVDIDSKSKAVSSDPPYEAITQQIAYLMSAITNQNPNKIMDNMAQSIRMGMGKQQIQNPTDPKR